MIKEANEDKNLLSKEKNDLIRKCEELHEVVSGLRAELVANEKKMKEQELEILVVSISNNCVFVCLFLSHSSFHGIAF